MTIKCSFFNACYYARWVSPPIHFSSFIQRSCFQSIYTKWLCTMVYACWLNNTTISISISDIQLMDISDTRNFLFTIFQIKALQWPSIRRNHSIHKHRRKQKLAFLVWMFKFTALLISMFFHIHPDTCFSKRPVMIFFPPLYWISARESFIQFWPFTFNFGMLCF